MRFSMSSAEHSPARFCMSTSPFLHAKFEKRRPIPRMFVMAYMILLRPSTLVFRTRRMCVKWSGAMRDPILPAPSDKLGVTCLERPKSWCSRSYEVRALGAAMARASFAGHGGPRLLVRDYQCRMMSTPWRDQPYRLA
jgi:hypothetical protein